MKSAIDFSEQKIEEAKRRNPDGGYYKQNFLEDYSYLKKYGINKVYSYSVMQYCKTKDFKLFIDNQLSIIDSSKEKIIGHLDVPDISKPLFYITSYVPELQMN